MFEFVVTHHAAIILVAIALVIALITLCAVVKLFKAAVGLGILCIIVPIIFTIFWGDGSEYVSRLASFFQPAYQKQIEDAYECYKQKDAEDPFVDYAAVSSAVTDVFQRTTDRFPRPSSDTDGILSKFKPTASP